MATIVRRAKRWAIPCSTPFCRGARPAGHEVALGLLLQGVEGRVALVGVERLPGRGVEEGRGRRPRARRRTPASGVEVCPRARSCPPRVPERHAAPALRPHQDLDREVGTGEHDAAPLSGQVLVEQLRSLHRSGLELGEVAQVASAVAQRRPARHDVGQRRLRVALLRR